MCFMMAGRAVETLEQSENSSSSDDEALRRCREAVWEGHTLKPSEGDRKGKDSKRVIVADHDHDGNDLQITKGFRTHVAKKLGHYLDSCISETQAKKPFNVECVECDDDADDAGFRLFSTSVPGQKAEDPPAPARRRPLPSSSDSDSEMERLKEAAVSIKDLLPTLSPPIRDSTSSIESPSSGQVKKKKKKEKKICDNERKCDQSKSQDTNLSYCTQGSDKKSEYRSSEQALVKQKKKKKRKRERVTEENATD